MLHKSQERVPNKPKLVEVKQKVSFLHSSLFHSNLITKELIESRSPQEKKKTQEKERETDELEIWVNQERENEIRINRSKQMWVYQERL